MYDDEEEVENLQGKFLLLAYFCQSNLLYNSANAITCMCKERRKEGE